jgi:hypothetical protein
MAAELSHSLAGPLGPERAARALVECPGLARAPIEGLKGALLALPDALRRRFLTFEMAKMLHMLPPPLVHQPGS